jgi:hypothetical protein
VRDLGLPLLSVTQVEPDHPRPDHPTHANERSPDGLD